jgi:hypothetical protein
MNEKGGGGEVLWVRVFGNLASDVQWQFNSGYCFVTKPSSGTSYISLRLLERAICERCPI